MSTPTPGWRPPAECPGCERPIRRATARSNGGYCTTCRPRGASPVQALPEGERLDLGEWQTIVNRRASEDRAKAAERAAKRRARRG